MHSLACFAIAWDRRVVIPNRSQARWIVGKSARLALKSLRCQNRSTKYWVTVWHSNKNALSVSCLPLLSSFKNTRLARRKVAL